MTDYQADGFDEFSPWLAPSAPGLPPVPGQLLPPAVASMARPVDVPRPVVDLKDSAPMPVPPGLPGLPPPAPGAGAFGDSTAVSPVPAENGHTLGLAFLIVGIGGAVGVKFGGLYGGAAGAMYGGALVNGIRAARCVAKGTPEADKEAAISATYTVIGAGVASYLVWKNKQKGEKKV